MSTPKSTSHPYHYVLVFPKHATFSKQPVRPGSNWWPSRWLSGWWKNSTHPLDIDRISYAESLLYIQRCVGGDEAREARVSKIFQQSWMEKFRCNEPLAEDTIPFSGFQELMREVILARLHTIPGLTLDILNTSALSSSKPTSKPTKPKNRSTMTIVCFVQAHASLLRQEAEATELCLPLCREIVEDECLNATAVKEYSEKEDAEKELYRMFLAGDIPSEEAQIFSAEMHPRQWSQRLHILQHQVQSKLKPAQQSLKDPKHQSLYHFPYQQQPHVQYVFQSRTLQSLESVKTKRNKSTNEHLNPNQNLPFGHMHQIRLVKGLLDREFDTGQLLEYGILEDHYCLHDQDQLQQFMKPKKSKSLSWWGKIRHPPIQMMRNYYGEATGFYFLYLHHYLRMMAGLVLWTSLLSVQHRPWINWIMATSLSPLSLVYLTQWQYQELEWAWHWGVSSKISQSSHTKVRPGFKGQTRISPITNRPELYTTASNFYSVFVGLTLLLILAGYGGLFFLALEFLEPSVGSVVFSWILGFFIPLASRVNRQIAETLNVWQNHRTEKEFEQGLILKHMIFQTFNSFGILVWMSVVQPVLGITRPEEALEKSTQLMQHIFMSVLTWKLLDIARALVGQWIRRVIHRSNVDNEEELDSGLTKPKSKSWKTSMILPLWASSPSSHEQQPQHSSQERYLLRPVTTSGQSSTDQRQMIALNHEALSHKSLRPHAIVAKYDAIMMCFGYVYCFGFLAPWSASVFALTYGLLTLVWDHYTQHGMYRRPFPEMKSSIGIWKRYLLLLSFLSVFLNAVYTWLYAYLNVVNDNVDENLVLPATKDQRIFVMRDYIDLCTIVTGFGLLWLSGFELVNWAARYWYHLQQLTHAYLEELYFRSSVLDLDHTSVKTPGQVYLNGLYSHLVNGHSSHADAVDMLTHQRTQISQELKTLGGLFHHHQGQQQQQSLGSIQVVLKHLAPESPPLPIVNRMTQSLDPCLMLRWVLPDASSSSSSSGGLTKSSSNKSSGRLLKSQVLMKTRRPDWNRQVLEWKELSSLNVELEVELVDVSHITRQSTNVASSSNTRRFKLLEWLNETQTDDDADENDSGTKSVLIPLVLATKFQPPPPKSSSSSSGSAPAPGRQKGQKLTLEIEIACQLSRVGETEWTRLKLEREIEKINLELNTYTRWQTHC